jgi:hypothetical protein
LDEVIRSKQQAVRHDDGASDPTGRRAHQALDAATGHEQ